MRLIVNCVCILNATELYLPVILYMYVCCGVKKQDFKIQFLSCSSVILYKMIQNLQFC